MTNCWATRCVWILTVILSFIAVIFRPTTEWSTGNSQWRLCGPRCNTNNANAKWSQLHTQSITQPVNSKLWRSISSLQKSNSNKNWAKRHLSKTIKATATHPLHGNDKSPWIDPMLTNVHFCWLSIACLATNWHMRRTAVTFTEHCFYGEEWLIVMDLAFKL